MLSNPRHEAFAQAVASGMTGTAAYRKVLNYPGKNADVLAARMLVKVSKRILEIQRSIESKTLLTIEEKRAYCAKTVRNPECPVPHALKAIELDSKISGELTDKIEQTGNLLQDGRVVVSLPEIIYTPRIKPTP